MVQPPKRQNCVLKYLKRFRLTLHEIAGGANLKGDEEQLARELASMQQPRHKTTRHFGGIEKN